MHSLWSRPGRISSNLNVPLIITWFVLYRERRGEILEEYRDHVRTCNDYQWTVYTTWTISFKRLSAQSARFLQLCAYLHHDGITEAIFRNAASNAATYGPSPVVDRPKCPKPKFGVLSKKKGSATRFLDASQKPGPMANDFLGGFQTSDSSWDSQKFRTMITKIRSYSLVEYDKGNHTYSIHPLVHG